MTMKILLTSRVGSLNLRSIFDLYRMYSIHVRVCVNVCV